MVKNQGEEAEKTHQAKTNLTLHLNVTGSKKVQNFLSFRYKKDVQNQKTYKKLLFCYDFVYAIAEMCNRIHVTSNFFPTDK